MIATEDLSIGLYIHIPFCVRKCHYCDFVSVKAGDEHYKLYVDAALGEMRYWREAFEQKKFSTVYLGGGTPSLLGADLLARLLDGARSTLSIASDAEVTVEVNPGTVSRGFWKALMAAGVTRVSIGVQSFSNRLLAVLGRVHDVASARRAVTDAQDAGLASVGIDLIYGIPGQTFDDWKETLDLALGLGLKHLSAYCLSYEEGTPFMLMRERGEVSPPLDEVEEMMYYHTICRLRDEGFLRYEISNFALPGFESRHNLNYWNYGEYLGIGVGAHSFSGGRRWENTTSVDEYLSAPYGGPSVILPPTDFAGRLKEFIMLGLRKAEGIAIADIERKWGRDAAKDVEGIAATLAGSGKVEFSAGRVRIADSGLFVSNDLMAEFF